MRDLVSSLGKGYETSCAVIQELQHQQLDTGLITSVQIIRSSLMIL